MKKFIITLVSASIIFLLIAFQTKDTETCVAEIGKDSIVENIYHGNYIKKPWKNYLEIPKHAVVQCPVYGLPLADDFGDKKLSFETTFPIDNTEKLSEIIIGRGEEYLSNFSVNIHLILATYCKELNVSPKDIKEEIITQVIKDANATFAEYDVTVRLLRFPLKKNLCALIGSEIFLYFPLYALKKSGFIKILKFTIKYSF